MVNDTLPWREFELFVAAIERTVLPLGATVVSPDRVPDFITGGIRDVDVAIRYKIGTTPILIAVECRKRSHGPDVQWIEQLNSKRTAIRAEKIIAVSATPFSTPALIAAQHHNIDTRLMSELASSDFV